MAECTHGSLKSGIVRRMLRDRKFESPGKICTDCGNDFFHEIEEDRFNDWLMRIHSREKDFFKLQPAFTADVFEALDALVKRRPWTSRSGVIRVLVVLYWKRVFVDQEMQRRVDEAASRREHARLFNGDKDIVQVRLSPGIFSGLTRIAAVYGLSPSKMVEQAVAKVLAFRVSANGRVFESEIDLLLELA